MTNWWMVIAHKSVANLIQEQIVKNEEMIPNNDLIQSVQNPTHIPRTGEKVQLNCLFEVKQVSWDFKGKIIIVLVE